MAMAKRLFLFVITNILIIATISILLSVLGVQPYIEEQAGQFGLDYQALLIFCLIWGMGGAFISLAMSRFIAKMMMSVKVIDVQTTDRSQRWLLDTVHRLSKSANLPKMPQVGIYNSPEVNAFATGPSKSRSLVAVSSGLMQSMQPDEVEGVLAHEVAHIANGDMVTMTLVQGVVNAFVMFFARILAFLVLNFLNRGSDREPSPFMHMGLIIVFQILFGFLGMIVVAYFSRAREFRADAGGATLGGRNKMIQALERLRSTTARVDQSHESLATLKISGGQMRKLFSTHPPLEERIQRLKMMT